LATNKVSKLATINGYKFSLALTIFLKDRLPEKCAFLNFLIVSDASGTVRKFPPRSRMPGKWAYLPGQKKPKSSLGYLILSACRAAASAEALIKFKLSKFELYLKFKIN